MFLESFFCREKTPEGEPQPSTRGWMHPVTLRSLVVRSTALTHIFDTSLSFVWHFVKLFGIIWDVSGGSLEVLRSNLRRIFLCFCKVSGRVQEGPRSPPDSLKKY